MHVKAHVLDLSPNSAVGPSTHRANEALGLVAGSKRNTAPFVDFELPESASGSDTVMGAVAVLVTCCAVFLFSCPKYLFEH